MSYYHDRDELERMCADFNHPGVRYVDEYDKFDDISAELLAAHLAEFGVEIVCGSARMPEDDEDEEDENALVDL